MKKSHKLNPAKRGRQKPRKTRLRTGQPAHQQELSQPIGSVKTKAVAATASQAPVRRPQGDPLRDEGKRKLWDQKQEQLEARWLEAQERQKEEHIAQRRTWRIAYSITGIALILLLCAYAWNFA